jgi:cell division transport system ATP-binding protein
MILLHRVTKRYPNGREGLAEVSLRFADGSMTFVTGHSGAGKSTLLKLLLLIESPTRGEIMVDGVDITRMPSRRIALYRRRVGVVYQDHHLLARRSVFDNVALPLRVSGIDEAETARRVRAALSSVGLLGMENLLPAALSLGEQQRVGIARAIVHRPALLLADEPTGNLDPGLSRDIMSLFTRFNQQIGTTVIVATHDLELVRSLACPVVELAEGRVREHAA